MHRFLLCFFATLCLALHAEQAPFSVTAPSGPTGGELMLELQHKAVVDWLQRYLGNRYEQYASRVTPEFARRYILDYSLGHPPGNRSVTVLTGHLDSEGLKKWVRVSEAKRGGGAMKIVFLFSSNVAGLTATAGNTSATLRESQAAQTLFNESNFAFHKFNARATPASNPKLGLTEPPRSAAELKTLQEYGVSEGYNLALWVQLDSCRGCTSLRMETLLYHLGSPRLAISRVDDTGLSAGDLAHADRVRNAVHGVFDQFRTDLESEASEGTLLSSSHRLVIEGLDSPRAFALIDALLDRSDFVDQVQLRRSEPQVAEYEILSPLKADELAERLTSGDLGGFHLKTVRVDPQALVVRYSK